jgi:hypothetical protein
MGHTGPHTGTKDDRVLGCQYKYLRRPLQSGRKAYVHVQKIIISIANQFKINFSVSKTQQNFLRECLNVVDLKFGLFIYAAGFLRCSS